MRQEFRFAQVQAPAERLPQITQQLRNRLVFPEGRAITQALEAAQGNNKTQNAAPAPAIIASNAKQALKKVCFAHKFAPCCVMFRAF